jgi:hypothetical protein
MVSTVIVLFTKPTLIVIGRSAIRRESPPKPSVSLDRPINRRGNTKKSEQPN